MSADAEVSPPDVEKETVLCMSYNLERSSFAIGTTRGFRVFIINPFRYRFGRDWGKGIGVAELLMRSNLLALVGGGPHPYFPPNHVVVWDDSQNKSIAQLEFMSNVLDVRLRRERIIVVLERSIFVYNFLDLSFIAQLPTFANPLGQIGVCTANPITIIYPAQAQGHLAIRCEDPADPSGVKIQPRQAIATHNGPLVCMALSLDGKFAATASDKGTLIRVWDTTTCRQLREFRRGSESAQIWSICFSQDNSLLAVSSSKGTCHIFSMQDSSASNRQSAYRRVSSYFVGGDRSSLQAPIPTERTLLAFAPDKSFIFVICQNGTCARINLDLGPTPSAKIDEELGWFKFFE